METQQQQRKPYFISRIAKRHSFKLHEGFALKYRSGGTVFQLYLTDEEVQKYDNNKVRKILRPYIEITKKRYMYVPSELVFYAISEVLYA